MKGCKPIVRVMALVVMLALAMTWSVTCMFDTGGLAAGDAGVLPDAADPDASSADAGLADGAVTDAAPPVDASSPCLGLDPPWWDHSWRRRRPIALGTVPESYTVALHLAGALQTEIESHTRGDLADLRVLRYDGTWLELDRIVRSETGFLRVRFRVREDQDGSPGQPRYFLYYDNPGATVPPAQPEEVFLFFDGFERGTLGVGTVYEQWDQDQFWPGNWYIDNGELVQDSSGALTVLAVLGLAGALDEGFALSYRWLGDTACADSGPVFHWDPGAPTGYYLERQYNDAVLFAEPAHLEQGRQSMPNPADDNWHRHELRYHGGTLRFLEDGNGPQYALSLTSVGTETVGVGTYCPRVGPFRFDNLMVRLFRDPEPTPTLGTEQLCDQL